MQVPSDRSTLWPASTSRPPNVMHGAGNSRLSRWYGTAAYGPGPSGRNSSADLPMGSGCPLRAQRLYSSTVDSSTDAGTQGSRDADLVRQEAERRRHPPVDEQVDGSEEPGEDDVVGPAVQQLA